LAAGAVGDTGGQRFLPDAAGAALIGFNLDPT
jgi:phage-related tail fiber protein